MPDMPVINARGLFMAGIGVASFRPLSALLSEPLALHKSFDFARNVIPRFRIDGLMVAKGDAPAHYARSMLQVANNAMFEQLHGRLHSDITSDDRTRFDPGFLHEFHEFVHFKWCLVLHRHRET